MVSTRSGSTPAKPSADSRSSASKDKYDEGTNYVAAGIEANPYFFALIIAAPFLSLLLGYLTSPEMAVLLAGLRGLQ